MTNTTRNDQATASARNLKAALAANGIAINHQRALDVIARMGGSANLHAAQAAIAITTTPTIAPAPGPYVEPTVDETMQTARETLLAIAAVAGFTEPTFWAGASYPDVHAVFNISQPGHETLCLETQGTNGLRDMTEAVEAWTAAHRAGGSAPLCMNKRFYHGIMSTICVLGGDDEDDGMGGDWSGEATFRFDASGKPVAVQSAACNASDDAPEAAPADDMTSDEAGQDEGDRGSELIAMGFGSSRGRIGQRRDASGTLSGHRTQEGDDGKKIHIATLTYDVGINGRDVTVDVASAKPLPKGRGSIVGRVIYDCRGDFLAIEARTWTPAGRPMAA